MAVDFKSSETMKNLMKAFAGESQARNRYTFAAAQAKKENLYVISAVFKFTAKQEREHAEIFYNHLKEMAGENIAIDGTYPVDITDSVSKLLRYAEHNEMEEYGDVYKHFSEVASQEGFAKISADFKQIGEVEKIHADRFSHFADLLEQNKLFISDVSCQWMCLNCGTVIDTTKAPEKCPVCNHDKGYFIRVELAPYTASCNN